MREKDGMWAVLAWLSILANHNKNHNIPLIGVKEIVEKHWKTYGRNYYSRYDFESIPEKKANRLMLHLHAILNDSVDRKDFNVGSVKFQNINSFTYTDIVDESVTDNQGIRIYFSDDVRAIFRLSGTGVGGKTIRLYIDKYTPPNNPDKLNGNAQQELRPYFRAALKISKMTAFTGRSQPSVTT